MGTLIKQGESAWQVEYVDGGADVSSLAQFATVVADAGLTTDAAVGFAWHVGANGRHTYDYNSQLIFDEDNQVWVPDDPMDPEGSGTYEPVTYDLLVQIESVAGEGFSTVAHRFGPVPTITVPRFWTGLQLATEIP